MSELRSYEVKYVESLIADVERLTAIETAARAIEKMFPLVSHDMSVIRLREALAEDKKP